MQLQRYNQRISNNLDVCLEDDYLIKEPEIVILDDRIPRYRLRTRRAIKKERERKVIDADVLVIGAGISGMQAALDIADKGYRVVIVEKTPTIGGSMVKLDKTFPTNDCSICTAAPKMIEVARHPNIKLLTYAEIIKLEGEKGNFKAKIWMKSRYVDSNKCTGCGDCAKVCPVEVISKFDEKISTRKAIYIEFPQAVPIVYTIDIEHCTGCGSCDRVCEAGAINFLEKSEKIEVNVGAIIVATGFELLEPIELRKEYGYGKYENVLTAIQYERLLSSFGPTDGKIVRPSDLKKPKKIGWIQCVGSRSEQVGYPYCSRVCCMYATKEAIITKESNPDIDISIYYMDIRAYGKDFQRYYEHAKSLGIKYIRGRPSNVYENEDKSLTIRYKDTISGEIKEDRVDLLVLSTSIIPSKDNVKLAKILGIEVDRNGFFLQNSLLQNPLCSTRDGIYLAGCAQGPKDIPDSVAMGSGAAAKAIEVIKDRERHFGRDFPPEREVTGEEPRIGVFVCHCGKNIAEYVDVERVTEEAKKCENVVHAEHVMFACSEDSCRKIRKTIEEKKLNRVVVAACSPCTHGELFRDVIREAGLNRYLFEMANIRNHCSWVHLDRDKATEKAKLLVKAAISKARLLKPLKEEEFSVNPSVLVIGGGISGMKAAIALAKMGIKSYLIEKEEKLGGRLNRLYTLFPSDIEAKDIIEPVIEEVYNNDLINVMTNAELVSLEGFIGNYKGRIKHNDKIKEIEFGTIIVATGFKEIDLKGEYGYGISKNVLSHTELEEKLKNNSLKKNLKNVVIINCVGAMSEDRPYCCRIGCGVSIKNAKLLAQRYHNLNIWLLYQDMRVFGKEEEEYYADVLKNYHVIPVRYPNSRRPEVVLDEKDPAEGPIKVKVYDDILGEELELPADLVVLTVNTEGETQNNFIKKMLKVPADKNGFFLEAHPKIRPLDFSTDGIYLCGAAHYPKNLVDSIAQAEGAASRAAIPIIRGKVRGEGEIAEVNEDLCSGCRTCEFLCPYSAIEMKLQKENHVVANINPALCKGCGSCASACPSGAIEQRGFTNSQIRVMIEALLER